MQILFVLATLAITLAQDILSPGPRAFGPSLSYDYGVLPPLATYGPVMTVLPGGRIQSTTFIPPSPPLVSEGVMVQYGHAAPKAHFNHTCKCWNFRSLPDATNEGLSVYHLELKKEEQNENGGPELPPQPLDPPGPTGGKLPPQPFVDPPSPKETKLPPQPFYIPIYNPYNNIYYPIYYSKKSLALSDLGYP